MSSSAPNRQPHRDRASWGELIATLENGTMLAAISSSMGPRLKQHSTVEDIWQETLFMAWRDRENFEWTGLRSFRAWLLAIARNRIRDTVDSLETKKRGGDRRVDSFSTLAPNADDSIGRLLPPGSTTPSRIARHSERVAAMEQALDSLPEDLREVVRLSLFEQLPIRSVAERLGISSSTVKRRLLRGAAAYRGRLEQHLGSVGGSHGATKD